MGIDHIEMQKQSRLRGIGMMNFEQAIWRQRTLRGCLTTIGGI
jgi:hypothetical protein